ERFTLAALVEDIQATFRPLTAEKGLEFAVSVEKSAPSELVTDRQRLRQVLGNLLSNAVKFTERGRVTLRVSATSADGAGGGGDRSVAVFSVTDTGIGIAPENLAVIFGAFQQGDGTLSRRYGGTGLGLSIASEVSALLGGTISATSDLGHGSTFILSVPAVLPDIPPSLPAPAFAGPDALGVLGDPLSLDGLFTDRNPFGSAGPNAIDHLHTVTSQANALAATATSAGTSDEADAFAAGEAGDARAPGPPASKDRMVLVFEPTSGGLLTLLAHSAVSDLTQLSTIARVSTATSPGQGTAMLAAEPYRCVVVDLGMPTALEFLDQVQEKPDLREIPVLAHAPGEPGDDLRERITLHLSAAQPGQVPPLVRDMAEPVVTSSAAASKVTALPEYPGL